MYKPQTVQYIYRERATIRNPQTIHNNQRDREIDTVQSVYTPAKILTLSQDQNQTKPNRIK